MIASVPAALAYGLARYRADACGKTLLVGWRAATPLFAIAAGLAADRDREHFAVLVRYLLRRDEADGYWLLLSADMIGREHLVAEVVESGQRQLMAAALQRDADNRCVALAAPEDLGHEAVLGDLLDGGKPLPAVLRRELDGLALGLAVPVPELTAL